MKGPKVLLQCNSTGTCFIVPYGTPRERWREDYLWIGNAGNDVADLLYEFDPDYYTNPDTVCVRCGKNKYNIRTSDAEGGEWFCSMDCLRDHTQAGG